MANVLAALTPVFLIIALGALLKRGLLPEASHWIGLERLTYFVLFPALLAVSIASTDLGGVAVTGVAIALLGAMLLAGITLMLVRRPLSRAFGLDGPGFTSVFQGTLRWNTYIGLAVSGGLAGAAGLAVTAVAIAVIVPMANTLSVVVLARHGGTGGDARRILAQLVRNPFIWACAAGIVINALHVPVPAVVMTFGEILGRASLALGLLVVGAGLRLGDLRRPRAATWLTALLKLLVLPAVAIAIGRAFGLAGVDLLVVAVATAVPSAPNGYVLARQMGGDAPLLAQILTIQTILAAITMPLVIAAVSLL